jgi:hypothetical protein
MLLLSAFALPFSGCAGTSAARDMSATGAELTDSYKTNMQTFLQAQDDMMKALVQSIASREQLAAVFNNQARVRRASWQAANNTAATRIYDSLSEQSDAAILATNIDLQSLHPPAAPATTTIDPKQFESVTKTLNQMAQKPSITDRVKFLSDEGSAVAKEYHQSLSDSAKCANTASQNTKLPSPSGKEPSPSKTAPSNC